jgi:endonuclease/exonuclease/phosphatase family metal-dependent hydrolase
VRLVAHLSAVLAGLALGGCDLLREPAAPDAGDDGDAGYREPVDDLVPPLGTDATLDVATWNIENLPKSDDTVALAADLITSLRLDVVVVQEVGSVAAWDELVARLPHHAGLLSPHRYTATSYQKIGVLYREDVVTVPAGDGEMLFTTSSYAWPRPAWRVGIEVDGVTIDLIGVHLKAGTADDDRARRRAAVRELDTFLRAQVDGGGEAEVIVLGDYNETLQAEAGGPDAIDDVLAPLLEAPERYRFRTADVADEATFIPSGRVIDHVLTTDGLAARLGEQAAVIPRLDAQVPSYESRISDHLPVVLPVMRSVPQ